MDNPIVSNPLSDSTSEEWRDIPGYEGLYRVSNTGRVMSLHHQSPFIMAPQIDKYGYFTVNLSRGEKFRVRVHKLVTSAFLGACPDGKQVNHINGVKNDNRIVNLEYVTPHQNTQHAVDTGLTPARIGTSNGRAKLTEKQVVEIRRLYKNNRKEVGGMRGLAKRYGVTSSTISLIITKDNWSHIK